MQGLKERDQIETNMLIEKNALYKIHDHLRKKTERKPSKMTQ